MTAITVHTWYIWQSNLTLDVRWLPLGHWKEVTTHTAMCFLVALQWLLYIHATPIHSNLKFGLWTLIHNRGMTITALYMVWQTAKPVLPINLISELINETMAAHKVINISTISGGHLEDWRPKFSSSGQKKAIIRHRHTHHPSKLVRNDFQTFSCPSRSHAHSDFVRAWDFPAQ